MARQESSTPYPFVTPCSQPRAFPVDQNRRLFLFVLTLACISWLLYFTSELVLACRITGSTALGQSTKPVWIVVGAEFLLNFQELILALGLLIGLASSQGQKPRPSYELRGPLAPTIDVLITCCGESVGVILDTVRAAAAQDYPSSSLRVLVLDDKRDDELQQSVFRLQPWLKERNFARVEYLARRVKKGTRSFFKAGNLNYGISAPPPKGGSPSEYFAGLDCDMIPETDWLRKCVTHMLLSHDIGMVVSPQVSQLRPLDPRHNQDRISLTTMSRSTTTSLTEIPSASKRIFPCTLWCKKSSTMPPMHACVLEPVTSPAEQQSTASVAGRSPSPEKITCARRY